MHQLCLPPFVHVVANREEGLNDLLQVHEKLSQAKSAVSLARVLQRAQELNRGQDPASGLSYFWILPSTSKSHMLVVLISGGRTRSEDHAATASRRAGSMSTPLFPCKKPRAGALLHICPSERLGQTQLPDRRAGISPSASRPRRSLNRRRRDSSIFALTPGLTSEALLKVEFLTPVS